MKIVGTEKSDFFSEFHIIERRLANVVVDLTKSFTFTLKLFVAMESGQRLKASEGLSKIWVTCAP